MDVMKQHDTLPNWRGRCLDGGTGVDLTTAVSIKVLGRRNGELEIEEDITGPYAADGWVEMAWPLASTDLVGYIEWEIEVIFPGPKRQTFPPKGYLRTTIYRDLG